MMTTPISSRQQNRKGGSLPSMLIRIIAASLWLWLLAVAIFLYTISAEEVQHGRSFFRWGPTEELSFLSVKINTWTRWSMLMAFVFVTSVQKLLGDEIISPWILNSLMDPKEHDFRTSWTETQVTTQGYYAFSVLTRFVQISVSVTQFDFVCVLLATDLVVSFCTTHMFWTAASARNAKIAREVAQPFMLESGL